MNAATASALFASYDPVLQEAAYDILAEHPSDPEEKKEFGFLILLQAIAAIVTIFEFCREKRGLHDMTGLALKEAMHTLTAHGRRALRRPTRQAIVNTGDYHGFWDLRRQTTELLGSVLRAGGKAEPGRIEAVVGAAMRQAAAEQEAKTSGNNNREQS